MTKKLFFICLIGLLSINSAYAACDGGTVIMASSGTFCKSNVDMNWWSAAVWCKTNGMHLATMYEMCPSWDGNIGSGKCPELSASGDGGVWSATANESELAFCVDLPNGKVRGTSYNKASVGRNHNNLAFCK